MPSYEETYARHAEEYEELVRHEDAARALDGLLDRALDPRPRRVVELGCGTGRVTRLLATRADEVRAYDGSAHMIAFARGALSHPARHGVTFGVADNASIPEPDASADAVVAGWSIGHVTGFFPDAWEAHARAALDEMRRVAKPGAVIVLFETLGTAVDAPGPPNERLDDLYALFERGYGLRRETLDTRYAFASADEAARVLGFFFGADKRARILAAGSPVVPEWTAAFVGTR